MSDIIGSSTNYQQQLASWLSPVLQSSSKSMWTRCWHGHTDGFAASTFHSKCDNKGPTVTIVQVGSYVFGGYTDKSWTGKSRSKAFLFETPIKVFSQRSIHLLKRHNLLASTNSLTLVFQAT